MNALTHLSVENINGITWGLNYFLPPKSTPFLLADRTQMAFRNQGK
jgi:hypothetical protein